MSSRKCIKNFSHEWKIITKLPTHTVKQCTRCKVKNFRARGFTLTNPHTPVPTRA